MVTNWFRAWVATSLVLGACCSPSSADILGASYFDNAVYRIDDETGEIVSGGISAGSAGLSSPAGLVVGPDGNIYVGSQGTGQVLFYDGETGSPLQLTGGDLGVFASMPGAGLSGLRFGPDGNLYVADFYGPEVHVFNGMTGVSLGSAATVSTNVGGLTFGPDGDMYVGDFSAATVFRIHDGMQETFVTAGLGGLQTPSSLLFLPSGNLLVVDLYGNKILQYDDSGGFVDVFAEIPPTGGDSNSPSDIQLDAGGNLIISTLGPTYPPDNHGAVFRYNFDTEMLENIASDQWPLGALSWIASVDAVPGDYNGIDGVGESDFLKWRDDFGKHVAPGGGADGNGDGIVDAADYTYWRDILTSLEMGAGAGKAAVPEPTSLVLLVWSALCLSVRWRRRH